MSGIIGLLGLCQEIYSKLYICLLCIYLSLSDHQKTLKSLVLYFLHISFPEYFNNNLKELQL